MTLGTLIWTTNGLYDRKQAADLLGVEWIIFCKAAGQQIMGSFWEKSRTASSFRVEMLGLCALHLLAKEISEHYGLGRWTAALCCDNRRVLMLSSHHNGRVRPSTKCTDIRRSFKATKRSYQGGFMYIHVYSHMDCHLLGSQLSLTQ